MPYVVALLLKGNDCGFAECRYCGPRYGVISRGDIAAKSEHTPRAVSNSFSFTTETLSCMHDVISQVSTDIIMHGGGGGEKVIREGDQQVW